MNKYRVRLKAQINFIKDIEVKAYEEPFEKVMHGFDFLELLARNLKYNTINSLIIKDNSIKLDYFDAITGESEEILYKIQRLNNFWGDFYGKNEWIWYKIRPN